MTDIVVHTFKGQQVRTTTDPDGNPLFVLNDACRALEITNTRNVAARLDADMKGVRPMDAPGGVQQLTVINGSYSI